MSDAALRVAVIGAGHLGRFHAQKYAALDNVELVAVADLDASRAAGVADECGTEACADYRTLPGRVDAVSVAVPAREHYAVGRVFLEQGVHVLMEKPIAVDVADAEGLVALARSRDAVLQIGHLERFNPAVLALGERLTTPLFVESHRIAPFQPRGTDVSVVLDLMIHDIELLLALIDAPLTSVDASGTAVLTDDIDIANARLRFGNGCVANVTASRVSAKSECKLRLFQRDTYFSLDLREKTLSIQRRDGDVVDAGASAGGMPKIIAETQHFDDHDALRHEIGAFVDAVRGGVPPLVSGEVGLRALQAAAAITRAVQLGDR